MILDHTTMQRTYVTRQDKKRKRRMGGDCFSYLELESFLTCICFGCFSLLLWQAQDIFDSPAEATQYTPGWAKVVAMGQVRCFGVLPCRRQNE